MHKVLIVEDDERQREAVAKLLSSDDVETTTASDAAECLNLLREKTFDCMVLDFSLPDESGFSLLETLSNETDYAFPPVIVYTGKELSSESKQKLRSDFSTKSAFSCIRSFLTCPQNSNR